MNSIIAKIKFCNGQSLVELLIVIGLTAVILPTVILGLISSRQGRSQQTQRLGAIPLLREAQDASRSFREKSWTDFAINGTFKPEIVGNTWVLTPIAQPEEIMGYGRQIQISNAYRDSNGAASTSGVLDPSTKLVTLTVSWDKPYPSSIQSVAYFTRYLDNLSFTESSYNEFNAGTKNGTTVEYTDGSPTDGEVVLGSGGQANWCRPQDAIKDSVTLPKRGNSITAKEGAVYVGTGDGTEGVTFVNMSISNPPNPTPPATSIVSTYTSSYKTNTVFSDGTYAYLATDDGSEQVVILDITVNPNVKIGSITIPGGLPANGVYVSGNILYVTSGIKLYTYDVTTKTGSHTTPLGSRTMWYIFGNQPQARQVIVHGNYAIVALGNALLGLEKYRISNGGRTITFVGAANLTWNQQSQGLAVNSTGTRAYVAFNNGAGFFLKGFFIVDISYDPFWLWPFYNIKGYYNTGSMDPRGMAIGTGNRAIVVGIGGAQQYQAIDISNESNPVLCGGLEVSDGVFGVSSVLELDGDAYSYIVTGEGQDQFKIIQGGNGGRYSLSGIFESKPFNLTSPTAFNWFQANVSMPNQTSISAQLGVASPSANCDDAAYTYVGPGATPSAYFYSTDGASISGSIPFGTVSPNYQNPERCFRYKFYFSTTDDNQTPELYDFSANYSP